MGLIGIIKDSYEKQKRWRQDEIHKDCEDNVKPYVSNCWRCLIDNVASIVVFVRNKKQ